MQVSGPVVPQTINECLTDNPVFVKIKLNKTIFRPKRKSV